MAAGHPVYEFEGFQLDTHTQCLLSPGDGGRRALKPKEYEVLLYFVQHAGELIAKETLLSELWPNLVVEENNLNQYVTALRKLLGEERGGRRFIMNVRARGYRFVPQVLQVAAAGAVVNTHRPAPPTANLIAWQCYQQAVHLKHADHSDRWSEAITLLERATALDPDFASAHAQLALTRIRLFMLDHPSAFGNVNKARDEARRAVQLRPDVAEGHMALGAINAASGHWVEAELNFLAARELDKEWVMPLGLHSSHVLLPSGHQQRALENGRQMLKDLQGIASLAALQAAVCVLSGSDDEAHKAVELAMAMGAEPTLSPLSDSRSMLAQRLGHLDEAADILSSTLSVYLQGQGTAAVIKAVFAAIGNPSQQQRAAQVLDTWVATVDFSQVPQTMRRQILLWYTEIGALDAAFKLAFRALDFYANFGLVGMGWGNLWLPEMAPFRRDPRFAEFAERLQLPSYWAAFGPPDGHLWRDGQLLSV